MVFWIRWNVYPFLRLPFFLDYVPIIELTIFYRDTNSVSLVASSSSTYPLNTRVLFPQCGKKKEGIRELNLCRHSRGITIF